MPPINKERPSDILQFDDAKRCCGLAIDADVLGCSAAQPPASLVVCEVSCWTRKVPLVMGQRSLKLLRDTLTGICLGGSGKAMSETTLSPAKVRRAQSTGALENECRHLAYLSSVNTPSSRNPAMMARDVLQPRCSWFCNNVFLSSRLTKCCELVAPPGMEERGGFFDAKSNQVWSSEMFLSHSSVGLQPALGNVLELGRHTQFVDLQTEQLPERLAGNWPFSARDKLETLRDVEAPKLRHRDGRLGEEPQYSSSEDTRSTAANGHQQLKIQIMLLPVHGRISGQESSTQVLGPPPLQRLEKHIKIEFPTLIFTLCLPSISISRALRPNCPSVNCLPSRRHSTRPASSLRQLSPDHRPLSETAIGHGYCTLDAPTCLINPPVWIVTTSLVSRRRWLPELLQIKQQVIRGLSLSRFGW
ncbi:hypothetical protein CEP53_001403 [Fusarium sp. AF-6]|nr:hypothetical protein CEP53_001403 [Fusarium sp. AF-6]